MATRMISQKKGFRCSECGQKELKWAGFCTKCGKAATMKEYIIRPIKPRTTATPAQKSVTRRWKKSEREIAREMTAVDGADPVYKNITSSTGRVGHITGIQIDGITKYHVIENKNRPLPKWLLDAWVQILQRSHDFNKAALLHLDPPNLVKEYTLNGMKIKTESMAVVTRERYKELSSNNRRYLAITDIMNSALSQATKIKKIAEILEEENQ